MITSMFPGNQKTRIPEEIYIESVSDSAPSGLTQDTASKEIIIIPDAHLLALIDESADLMGITRETLVMKILKLWEKKNRLPLQGKNNLCRIIPEKRWDNIEDSAPSVKNSDIK